MVSYDRLSVSADKGFLDGEVVECMLDDSQSYDNKYNISCASFEYGPVTVTINVDAPIILTRYGLKSGNCAGDSDPKQWELVAVNEDESE